MNPTEEPDKFRRWLRSQLRQLWCQSSEREVARAKARVSWGKYKCAECLGEKFGRKDVHIDHIDPVVDTLRGFRSWDEYINRLFIPVTGLRILCKKCHSVITKQQNAERRKKQTK